MRSLLGVQELPFGDVVIGAPNGAPNGCQFGAPGADH